MSLEMTLLTVCIFLVTRMVLLSMIRMGRPKILFMVCNFYINSCNYLHLNSPTMQVNIGGALVGKKE